MVLLLSMIERCVSRVGFGKTVKALDSSIQLIRRGRLKEFDWMGNRRFWVVALPEIKAV